MKVLDGAIEGAKARYKLAGQELVQLYINRGITNQWLHLNRKALKDYAEALALEPDNLTALFRKGQVLQLLGRVDEAVAAWQAAAASAGPASDVNVLAQLHAALKAAGSTASTSAEVEAASSKIAPQSTPIANGDSLAAPAVVANGGAKDKASVKKPAGFDPRKAFAAPTARAKATTSPVPAAAGGGSASAAAADSASTSAAGGSSALSDDSHVESIDCSAAQEQARPSLRHNLGPNSVHPADAGRIKAKAGMIQIAITQINAGNVQQALGLLDQVLNDYPHELSALVARGTARALLHDLQGAVKDFSTATRIDPKYPESWKRLGQALSALNDMTGALDALEKAAELLPAGLARGYDRECNLPVALGEIATERGMIYQKMRNYRLAARELDKATKHDPQNVQAWILLGLVRTSMGDIRQGVGAYKDALRLSPGNREALLNMGQALKEEGRVAEAEAALMQVIQADPSRPPMAAYRLLVQMKQGQGMHAHAAQLASRALDLKVDDMSLELLYLRAICYHALGYARLAATDYDACVHWTPRSGSVGRGGRAPGQLSEEAIGYQFLSFYQKEMALYTHKNLDRPVSDYCLDTELLPLFKEQWCKKGPLTNELLALYEHQPPAGESDSRPPPPPPEQLAPLTAAADAMGVLLQNRHQGFLPNVRQQRAAGLGAIELAQLLAHVLEERRAGRVVMVKDSGASGKDARSDGLHEFGWRDAMDVIVKWRQLAEPADQVVWVDRLTRREFENGFGSHTPMFSGQTKCVRYYMNCSRALDVAREVLLRNGHATDAANQPVLLDSAAKEAAVRKATTPMEMYEAIGVDSWVVVPLASVANPSRQLEGTRLTLVKVPNQPDAHEFSIRTPVTPDRWAEFDAELAAAFERLLDAMQAGSYPRIATCILHYAYYWYNFMPLARGTAAVGYTTLLSLFWAAGMPVTSKIPQDYQVDWEAILSQNPDAFIQRLSTWLLPEGAKADSPNGRAPPAPPAANRAFPPVATLPLVAQVLGTTRRRLEALNGPDAERV